MAGLKTKKNDASVQDFLKSIPAEQKRHDSKRICEMITKVSGEKPAMWGGSIIGFGNQHYRYESGREGDWMKIGFSPRKASITVYFMDGFVEHTESLEKLGTHSTSKGCLHIKKLSDIDESVLEEMIRTSLKKIEKGITL